MITSVNIVGKLPDGLVEQYTEIHQIAEELAIELLVVGAMARDLVLVHGFGSSIERATKDVDFGINVESWTEFSMLRDRLLQVGYEQDRNSVHRFVRKDKDGLPWEIDIVPFGKVANESKQICWPSKGEIVMSVLGFQEAFEHALDVQFSKAPDIVLSVASPVGFCMLKLVSWLDRRVEARVKDATDFSYLIQNYSKIPEVYETLHDEGYMKAQEWDDRKASAMKLGIDVATIASPETIKFLNVGLFGGPDMTERIARDMQKFDERSLGECMDWFDIFANSYKSVLSDTSARTRDELQSTGNCFRSYKLK